MKASLLRVHRAKGLAGYVLVWLRYEFGYGCLEIKLGSLLSRRQRQLKTLASELPADLQASITDPEGADSLPIVTYT